MSEQQKPAGDEPEQAKKRQQKKRRAKLTPKDKERLTEIEANYMGARLEGATMKEATEAAGLAPFAQTGYKIEKRVAEKCPEIFERVGVTIERIAKKVSDKLDAMTDKHFHNKGIVMETRTVEDHAIQLHAAELGLKVLGALRNDDNEPTRDYAPAIVINLAFLGPRRAAEVLGIQPSS